MEIFDSVTGFLSTINFEVIFQLTCLGLIVISGPIVIAFLAFKGGDM
jgi:hypothetical protein